MSMNILNLLNDKKICVFCRERKRREDMYLSDGTLCVCRHCINIVKKTAPSQPFKGTNSIEYVLSPLKYDGKVRDEIINLKFNGDREYAPLMVAVTEEYLKSFPIWDMIDFIVPVPLHQSRFDERGYNQSELLACPIGEMLNIPVRTDCVTRVKATKRQSRLRRAERATNVYNAFSACKDLTNKNILLFDDIFTTGFTLESCAKALKQAGAYKVYGLSYAINLSENIIDLY